MRLSLSIAATALLFVASSNALAEPALDSCGEPSAHPLASVARAVDVMVTPPEAVAKATALCAETKLGAIVAPGIPAPPPAAGRLVIVNKGPSVGDPGKSSVMLLDLTTGKMERTNDTKEQGPHEIAVSPDGSYGVAPNYGLAPQGQPPLPGEGTSITVVDFRSGAMKDIHLGEFRRPHGDDFIDDERVAVTVDGKGKDLSAGYVLVVNVRTGEIEKVMPTGQAGTHLVRLSPDKSKLFATNIQGESFTVLDLKTGAVVKTVHTGRGAEGFDFSPDGREIWVANQDDSTIDVIDGDTLATKEKIRAPGGPIRVKFTADGSRVFTADRAGNSLTVYDARKRRISGKVTFDVPRCDPDTRLPVFGKSSVPMQIVLPPGSKYAYVPNSHSDLVTVIDTTDLSIQGYYKAGTKPDPMAWYAAPVDDLSGYPHLAEKYATLGGADRGVYSGEGKGGSIFELPRRVDPAIDGARFAKQFPEIFGAKNAAEHSMEFPAFLRMIEATIPADVLVKIDEVVEDAKKLAGRGLAAPFPYAEEEKLRHTIRYSWLHSRDLTVIHNALGYPIENTGRHDIYEYVKGQYIKEQAARSTKDAWYLRYLETLGDDEDVNVGFFNPHWVADIYGWRPDVNMTQNAMDAHRLTDNHDGNPQDSWDPVEAAVNNVYHRRELHFGVRKDAGMTWVDLGRKLEDDEEAKLFIKSGVGVQVARDAAAVMALLETEGKIVPWNRVRPGSAPDAPTVTAQK